MVSLEKYLNVPKWVVFASSATLRLTMNPSFGTLTLSQLFTISVTSMRKSLESKLKDCEAIYVLPLYHRPPTSLEPLIHSEFGARYLQLAPAVV